MTHPPHDPFMDMAEGLLQHYAYRRDSEARREELHLLKAIRLAPNITVAEALLAGEPVPRSALDPQWAKAYGL